MEAWYHRSTADKGGKSEGKATTATPEIFKKLGRTIRQWFEPIIRIYGYRNFQNYRLRVLIECGHVVI